MTSTASRMETQSKADRFSKDVPWYHKQIEDLTPACRELFENYSHIPPDKIESHVSEVRERAWAIKPYPCIGMWKFLNFSISLQPCYPRILSYLKEPQSQHTLLDLGCCFAQDIRRLAYDGVPSDNLYACDLEQSFLDLSYYLFRDRETMKAHLFTANALDENSTLDDIEGKIDVAYLGSFLHLFSWDDQLKVCKKVIRTLRPQKGSTAFGRQMGSLEAREMQRRTNFEKNGSAIWRHDVESFKKLWVLAGEETGTRWRTWAILDTDEGMDASHWSAEGTRQLKFEVERVE